MTLRTELVTLRPWADNDVEFVLKVAADPVIPLISAIPSDADTVGAQAFISTQRERYDVGQGWAWAMCDTAAGDAEVVGYVGALWTSREAGRASIGYWTHVAARRGGLTAAAVMRAADWLLAEGGVARLEAYIEPRNTGSMLVAERAGFECEGLMRSFAPLDGSRVDAYLYARIAGAGHSAAVIS